MYGKLVNGNIENGNYTFSQLRKDHPQVSFPREPSDELMAEYGRVSILDAKPAYGADQAVEKVGHSFDEQLGSWKVSYVVRSKTASEIKSDAVNSFEQEISAVESVYTAKERETWPQQVAEAKAIKKNGAESTPMLDAILSERPDLTKQQLIDKVETKATEYSAVVGAALGRMQEKIADLVV